jgi:hypothetical protein
MKEIIIIKLFLVLCCDIDIDGAYTYEVKNVENHSETGIIGTNIKYSIGDTIKFEFKEKIMEVKN